MRSKDLLRSAIRVALPTLVAVTVGCGPSIKYFPMNTPPDNIVPAEIEVMTLRPDRPYVELGIIQVKESDFPLFSSSSGEEMINALKEKATSIGADAIVLTDFATEMSVTSSIDAHGNSSVDTESRDIITALAIAWE